MIQKELQYEMERILPQERILYNEPMDRHCSFRTGGPADALAVVRTETELSSLLALLKARKEPFFLLGKGTNLLIGDGGCRGVIVTAAEADQDKPGQGKTSGTAGTDRPGMKYSAGEHSGLTEPLTEANNVQQASFSLCDVRVEGNRVIAGAGATMKAAALAAMEHGLSGLEFAAGIPGSVGGGLVMNAGAFGGEMRQVVQSVRLLMPDGTVRDCGGQEMEFGYRTSLLRRIPAVAMRAEFVLEPGDPAEIRAKIADLGERRRSKQPLAFPSAGSTFKRPEGYFAGKLIMDAGLAGYTVGGAQVSEKHCGFVINRGGATSAQIRMLIEDVQKKVYEDAGVRLEPEVIFWGEF